MSAKRFDIIGGPSRDVIFDAMKHYIDKEVIIPVRFDIVSWYSAPPTTDGCTKTLLDIQRVEIEEIKQEKGYKLKLGGRLEAKLSEAYLPYQFAAVYDTATCRGSIEITRIPGIIR